MLERRLPDGALRRPLPSPTKTPVVTASRALAYRAILASSRKMSLASWHISTMTPTRVSLEERGWGG